MSNNETTHNEDAKILSGIFADLKTTQVEPSPYLKTRVLARVREQQVHSKLMFWKVLSLSSLASLAIVTALSVSSLKAQKADGIANQAYVIHIDFNEADKTSVANAQIELPKDVHFVSKNEKTRTQKTLTLPVAVKTLGKGKLPFVVSADFAGEKEIKVRLLNADDQLVREQVLKLRFAKGNAAEVIE